MDPLTLTLIAGAVSSGGKMADTLINRNTAMKNLEFQQWQNLQNAKLQKELYAMQRRDAVADWNAQNRYNHPLQQMNRLRQAGLNPNLVYGKGAATTADAIRSATMPNVNTPAPEMKWNSNIGGAFGEAGNALMHIYDLKAKEAQIDNVNQSTALMQQENLFKQANTAKVVQDTARSSFELGKAQELKDSVIQNAQLQNEKLKADITYTLDQNQRQELANSSNVQLTMEKIISEKIAHAKDEASINLLKSQLEAVRQTTDIAKYEAQLTQIGIHKSDPWYFRALMNLIHGNMSSPVSQSQWNNFKAGLETYMPSHQAPKYNMERESQWMKKK